MTEPILETTLVTPAQMIESLQSLGVGPGQTLIVHSSMKKIGWIIGGARTVVDALLFVLGPTGTLVMPAQSGDNSEPSHWVAPPVPPSWWPLIRDLTPAFDPQTTPLRRMGAIADCFWHYPGVLRSNHPLDSFIARGPEAAGLVATQPLEAGLGEQSPTAKLYDLDAHVLLLGVDYDNCTVMHLAEYRSRSRISVRQGSAIFEYGQRVWREYQDLALDSDEFIHPGRLLDDSVRVSKGKIGLADCHLFKVRDAVDETANWLRVNRHHRILTEEKPAILETLKRKPVENLFAIGDLENFPLDSDFFEALALYQPGPEKILDSLVIRYHQNLIVACPADTFKLDPLRSASDHPSIQFISGRTDVLEQLRPHRLEFDFQPMHLLAIEPANFKPFEPTPSMAAHLASYPEPEEATLADIPALAELFAGIAEFSHSTDRQERIRELTTAMASGCCHYTIQREHGQIVASAGTTAENSTSAMIVGVCTAVQHRGRGLASRLVSTILSKVIGQRFQSLALFYDNPDAGRIYCRLGFATAGDWMMASRKH
ncbi:MAG: GNAT family N-acetyltransferase [Clostridia bacterium]|nr:GNAT family N-acetyltransferase [Clostridia bacterium]